MKKKILYTIAILIWVTNFWNCSRNNTEVLSAGEQFQSAKFKYLEKNYRRAGEELENFVRIHSASEYSEEAQFLLAESYYHREEYLLAATEYRYFLQRYPESEDAEDARFKLAMSYYNQSPKAVLDQSYTEQALKEFNRYFGQYGEEGKYTAEVKRYFRECRNKFAEKTYKNGYTYQHSLKKYEASIVYYEKVLAEFPDTDWVDDALLGIAKSHQKMREWDQAVAFYEKMIEEHPESDLIKEAKENIKECLEKKKEAERISEKDGIIEVSE